MVTFNPALPDTAHVGDLGHVNDHNAIVKAVTDLNTSLELVEARIAALEGVTPPTTPLPYGPGIGTDTIANIALGDQTWLSQKFKAEYTGKIVTHQWVLKGTRSTGTYAGGSTSGSVLRVSVQADNGTGKPNGTDIDGSYYTWLPPNGDGHYSHNFSGSGASVIAGGIYHLVFHNTDPTPTANWVSVNNILTFSHYTPRQPRYPDSDLGILTGGSGTSPVWMVGPPDGDLYTPTFQIWYAGGATQGQGYVDMQSSGGCVVSGTNMLHEKFTVQGASRTINTVWLRLARHGSGTDPLTIRLEDSTQSLIASATIAAASIWQDAIGGVWSVSNGIATTDDYKAGDWVSATFATPQTLQSGQTYNLRLSCAAGTTYWMRLLEQGDVNGYSAGMFTDGYAEASTNSGTSWNDAPSGVGSQQGDMQFYLT